jgi:hypothetical protein
LLTVVVLCSLARSAHAWQLPSEAPPKTVAADRDLITRFRFSERYTTASEPSDDGPIGQYRVGFKDLVTRLPAASELGDNKQTAKEPPSPIKTQHLIVTERPAEVNSLGQVKSLLRLYEHVRISDETKQSTGAPESIEGLKICYRALTGEFPQIISLDDQRALRYEDYWLAARQIYVPDLASVLPSMPVRIGDTWPLTKMGMRVLVGVDQVLQGNMEGKFLDLRATTDGRKKIAVMEIGGRILAQRGALTYDEAVKAEIHFAFSAKLMEEALANAREEAIVEARGALVRWSVGMSITARGPDKKEVRMKGERVMERQLDNVGDLLAGPHPLPKMEPANSWLTHTDPKQRFYFQHPQDLCTPVDVNLPGAKGGPDKLELIHWRPGYRVDQVTLEVAPGKQREPEEVKKRVLGEFKENKIEFLEGSAVWLPETEWHDAKTFRFEAAIMGRGRSARGIDRLHLDCYVRLFQGKGTLIVTAITPQDPPIRFRKDTEAMLKTFRWRSPKEIEANEESASAK